VKRSKKKKSTRSKSRLSAAKFAEMIDEATVDAHDESEQVTGWFTMLENYLDLPFDTEVLGVRVTVERLDLRNDSRIVATCKRNNAKQVVDITELPLPTPRPAGAEWIEAYCRWRGGR